MHSFPLRAVIFYGGALLITGTCGVVVGLGVAGRTNGQHPTGAAYSKSDEDDEIQDIAQAIEVNVIRPKPDKNFQRSITGPAYVEPYYQSDLYAHVAGPVKYIRKDIGDRVSAGELLVEIEVPDLVTEIAQREAMVQQAIADRDSAKANVKTMEEAVETAKTRIPEKQAQLEQAEAFYEAREAELARLTAMVKGKGVTIEVIDERTKETKAAKASCKMAQQAIKTAESELRVTLAKLDGARADLKVMEARINVAEKEKQRIEAKAEWAQIRAPFTGVVTARHVDPGSFVQDATTARTQPMLTIMRLDRVTVAMLVPERAAPFVRVGMDAVIHLEVEPGKQIQNLRLKLTRFAPFLNPDKGRTMRAEVDIYNPPERGFKKSLKNGVGSYLAPLAATQPFDTAALWTAGRQVWARPGLLKPGMYGTMQLVLQDFENAQLIPSSSVFSSQGLTYVYLVEGDVVKRVQVRVQYEDGVQAKASIVTKPGNADLNEEDELREFTGSEQIVRIGQGELRDGQKIVPKQVKWK